MFKLTDEEINEIIELYGGSKKLINKVEQILNSLAVIEDEEDYLEIIKSIVAQKNTNNELVKNCVNKIDAIYSYISVEEIIIEELNRFYNNFEDSKKTTKQKVLLYRDTIKRHN